MAEQGYIEILGRFDKLVSQLDGIFNQPRVLKNITLDESPMVRSLGRITGQASEFNKSLDAANARVLAFGASAGILFSISRGFTEIVKSTIDVEKSLTDINVILDVSKTQLASFGQNLFKIANDAGQTFAVAAEAAKEFSRQGFGVNETLERTRAALILTRQSGLDAANAVGILTATLNSFQNSALTAFDVVNKIANVDAKFAVSSADLAEGIKRVGSVAVDAGLNLDQLIGLITAIKQVTGREGPVIGNALKTIFTKLENPGVLAQLNEAGIAVSDLKGAALPTINVLENLAKSFYTLSEAQKQHVGQIVGGLFQINQLKAALSDLSKTNGIYKQSLDVSSQSTDEAIQRNEKLNQTLSARLNAAGNNARNIGSQLGNVSAGPVIGAGVDAFNSLFSTGEEDGKTAGNTIGKGILEGIGQVLTGPGVIVAALGLFKILERFTVDAAQSLQSLLGGNQALSEQKAIAESIVKENLINVDTIRQINSGTITTVELEQRVIEQLRSRIALRAEELELIKSVSATAYVGGIGFNAKTSEIISSAPGRPTSRVSNFAKTPIEAAVDREREAGIPDSLIKIGKDNRLISPGNPLGLGVYNLKDEPHGISQGIDRVEKNSKMGYIASSDIENFADVDPRLKIRPGFIGGDAQASINLGNAQRQFDALQEKLYDVLQGATGTEAAFQEIKANAKLMAQNLELSSQSQGYITGILNEIKQNYAIALRSSADITSGGNISKKTTQLNPTVVPIQPPLEASDIFQDYTKESYAMASEKFSRQKEVERQANLEANNRGPLYIPSGGQTFYNKPGQSEAFNDTYSQAFSKGQVPLPEVSIDSSKINAFQVRVSSLADSFARGEIAQQELNNQLGLVSIKYKLNAQEVETVNRYVREVGIEFAATKNLISENVRNFTSKGIDTSIGDTFLKSLPTLKTTGPNALPGEAGFNEIPNPNEPKTLGLFRDRNLIPPVTRTAIPTEGTTILGPDLPPIPFVDPIAARNQRNADLQAKYGKAAFAATIGIPILGGLVKQGIGQDSEGARNIGAGIDVATQTASLGALGFQLGGLHGAAIGAAGGAFLGLLESLDKFGNKVPDVQRALDKVTESVSKGTDSFSKYSAANEKIHSFFTGNTQLNPKELQKLEGEKQLAFSQLPQNIQQQLSSANNQSDIDQIQNSFAEGGTTQIQKANFNLALERTAQHGSFAHQGSLALNNVIPDLIQTINPFDWSGRNGVAIDNKKETGQDLGDISKTLLSFTNKDGKSALLDYFNQNPTELRGLDNSNPLAKINTLKTAAEGNPQLQDEIEALKGNDRVKDNISLLLPQLNPKSIRLSQAAEASARTAAHKEYVRKNNNDQDLFGLIEDDRANIESDTLTRRGATGKRIATSQLLASQNSLDLNFQSNFEVGPSINDAKRDEAIRAAKASASGSKDQIYDTLREAALKIFREEAETYVKKAQDESEKLRKTGNTKAADDLLSVSNGRARNILDQGNDINSVDKNGSPIDILARAQQALDITRVSLKGKIGERDGFTETASPSARVAIDEEIKGLRKRYDEVAQALLNAKAAIQVKDIGLDQAIREATIQNESTNRAFNLQTAQKLGGGLNNIYNASTAGARLNDVNNSLIVANLNGNVLAQKEANLSTAKVYQENGLRIPDDLRAKVTKDYEDELVKTGVAVKDAQTTAKTVVDSMFKNGEGLNKALIEVTKSVEDYKNSTDALQKANLGIIQFLSDATTPSEVRRRQNVGAQNQSLNASQGLLEAQGAAGNFSAQRNLLNARNTNNLTSATVLASQNRQGLLFSDEFAAQRQRINEESIRTGKSPNEQTGQLDNYNPLKGIAESFANELKYSFKDALRDINQTAKEVADTLKGSISSALKDLSRGAIGFGEAARNVGLAVAQKIVDRSIDSSVNSLVSLGGSAVSSLTSSLFHSNGGLITKGYADGGIVKGGAGGIDDIPATLSSGEFIVKKSSVDRIGKANLDKINGSAGVVSANYSLDNKFTVDNESRPTIGTNVTSPFLSDLALLDPNNPQNALRLKRESITADYIQAKSEYDKQKQDALDKFESGQRTAFYISLASAAVSVGGAYAGSKFGSNVASQGYVPPAKGTTFDGTATNINGDAFNSRYQVANGGLIDSNIQQKYASGGEVKAMISDGEYLLSKSAVSRIGVKNAERLNKYADGGSISSQGSINSISATEPNPLNESIQKLISLFSDVKTLLSAKKDEKPSSSSPSTSSQNSSGPIQNITVNNTVNVASNGNVTADSSAQGGSKGKSASDDIETSKKLSDLMKASALEVIISQSRPGGLLAPAKFS